MKNTFFIIPMLFFLILLGCADSTEKSEDLLRLFVSTHEEDIANLDRNFRLAHWRVLMEHNPANTEKALRHAMDFIRVDEEDSLKTHEFYHLQMEKMYSNRDDLYFLEKLQLSNHIQDPVLLKQLDVLISKYKQRLIMPELYKEYTNNFIKISQEFSKQHTLDNHNFTYRNNLELLATSQDPSELKKVWHENEEIAKNIHNSTRKIVQLQNKIVEQHSNGEFDNYYIYAIDAFEFEKNWLDSLRIRIEQETRLPYLRQKRGLDSLICKTMRIHNSEIRPWHYGKFIQARTPSLITRSLDNALAGIDIVQPLESFFYTIDLPLDDVIQNSNLITRLNMDPRSFHMVIDPRKKDIRAHVHLGRGLYSLSAFLYVLGGAASSKFISDQVPYLLHTQDGTLTRISANYFSRYSFDAKWLNQHLGIQFTPQQEQQLSDMYQTVRLFRIRRILLLSHFVEELYKDPNRDLETLWTSLVYKYLYISYPEGREIPWWASIMNVARASIRNESVLMAYIAEAQIDYFLGKDADDVRIGLFFKELFQNGETVPWQETLKKALGEKLNAKYLLQEIS